MTPAPLRAIAVLLAYVLWCVSSRLEAAETPVAEGPSASISISADFTYDWEPTGLPGRAYLLRGHCRLTQGLYRLTADQAVVWIARVEQREQVQVYLEGDVLIETPRGRKTAPQHFALWTTGGAITLPLAQRSRVNLEYDAVYRRALERRQQADEEPAGHKLESDISLTAAESGPNFPVIVDPDEEFIPESSVSKDSTLPTPIAFAAPAEPLEHRRLRLFSRSASPFNLYSFEDPRTSPPEQVLVITGGVNLVIDGLDEVGTVDLRADHMVLWTQAVGDFDSQAAATFTQRRDAPLQVYLEGNVIVLQERTAAAGQKPMLAGTTRTRAKRAFFDVRENRAILQQVELKFETPGLPLAVRIQAEEVRQLSKATFQAQQAWVTTSRFGKPGYKIAASEVLYEERPKSRGLGNVQQLSYTEPGPDQSTAEAGLSPDGIGVPPPADSEESVPWITAVTPTFQVEDVPVFGWYKLSAPAQFAGTPLKQISAENDRVFGGQVRTRWDLAKLFGREAPEGTDFELLADYLSRRGPALGLNGNWNGENQFGGYKGQLQMYGLHDDGTDNLGADRRSLDPDDQWRGNATLRHKQEIGEGLLFFSEFSDISDRNYLEQFFESEWDTGKDHETLLGLKAQQGQYAGTLLGRVRLNDFDTTTEWLPKADAYVLGKSFFDGRVNYSSHSSVGYGRLRPATAPLDPNDIFTPLPFVADREGLVTMSRHELSAPLMLGPVKIVPYALGEAAYWSEDLNANDMFRLYGSAGVRGAVMFTKGMPNVENSLLGLRGLVHKMTLDFDYSYSDSSQSLSDVAQYNEFDEQAQYRFRNRLLMNTFNGLLPAQFDPRSYAVRSGAGRSVTAPYFELVDTQDVLRLGMRHRLQTQDGPFDAPHWRDWMTLDLEASFFPHAGRDNYGESFGLLSANYAWNFSERTSLIANAAYDLFDDAQQLWNVGIVSQRGERGSVYFGVRQIKGAGLDSQIATASYSYEMSEKWISTAGTAWDLHENRNLGQSFTLTRVGADWLFHLGANYDASKNNAGVQLMIEPRFLQYGSRAAAAGSPRLGNLGPGSNY